MQPHPIPQNVTTFEFHLVGDMTLKQFLYLATGAGIAYVVFVFFAPLYPVVAWPAVLISASLGAAFAFLPIGSRPLDYWLKAFLKAVYSPTKRVWQKNGKLSDHPLFSSRLNIYLASLQPKAEYQKPQIPIQQPFPTHLPTTAELGKTVDLARQAQNLQLKIIQTERTLNQIKVEAQKPTAIPLDYGQQISKIMADLQNLVSQAAQIRQQLDRLTQPQQIEPTSVPVAQFTEQVKVITPIKLKPTQLALTSFPNVINGVIADNKGNFLEGTIAVIYDKEGLPVRALKTNKLGQFTGSTPLPNGTYKLTLEKDGYAFDVLQVELNGEVLPPLLIKAK